MREGYKMTELGELPEDWEVILMNDLIRIKHGYAFLGANFTKEVNDNLLLSPGNFRVEGGIRFDWEKQKFYKGPIPSEYILKEGDLVIAMTDLTQSCNILGAPAFIPDSKFNYLHNQRLGLVHIIDANKLFKPYLFYTLNYKIYRIYLKNTKTGTTVSHTSPKTIYEVESIIPLLSEQKKIAQILTTVDQKIDNIEAQIKETQALKKGLMQRLLTRGIGHTRFKETVLGEVPEEWEVVKFGYLISSHGYGPRFNANDYSEIGNVKTIRGTDVSLNGDIAYDQVPIASLPDELVSNHKLKDLDLVMITTADCGLTGVFREQGMPFIPSAYAVKISLNEKAFANYFKYLLQSSIAKNQVKRFVRKGTVANLPGSDILKFLIPLPSILEQERIASIFLLIDEKLTILQAKKQTYQSLKKGLMQNLLTGKIRVNL